MLTHTLHITLGVHMELHAPLNHHSVLPYVHILVAGGDSMDWYVFPWSFLQAKRYVNCIFLWLWAWVRVCFYPRKFFLWVFMSSEVKWGFSMVLNTMPTFFLFHFAILQGFQNSGCFKLFYPQMYPRGYICG